ncbi:radical SAM protein [Romboutsia sp. 1001285H_161024_C4]|uniref:radical SAM protein n=1 Tax=Romboutsia sp. 1001285H_161024_C4 TaxID=2787109 RepID=UPI001897B94D|nr:radical SAM protein [Romboutsia sp. 1001285H_161024_C4]
MFIKLKDIWSIHYFDDYSYLIFNNGYFMVLDPVQTYIIKALITSNYEYEKAIDFIKEDLDIDIDQVKNTVNIVICDLDHILIKQEEPNNNPIITSGKSGLYFPESIQISLTNVCKHKCKHCYKLSQYSGKHLDYNILEKFLNYIYPYCSNISLTGGEPFEYKNIITLLENFGDKFDLSITTSGYFEKDIPYEYYKKFSLVQVTLYGSNSYQHDSFVGLEGSFDKVKEFITLLVNNNINTIVTYQRKTNDISEIDELIKLCIKLGVKKVMIGEILPVGRSEKNKLHIENNDRESQMNELKNKYIDNIKIIFDKSENIVPENDYFFKCYAGFKQWHIVEDGRIVPCSLVDYDLFEMGNIFNEDSYMSLIKDGVYEKIQSRWLNDKIEIYNTYKNRGINISDICNKIESSLI